MGVTIRDVARLAGVSATTVSHALSGKRRVSAHTQTRINGAIDKLGYRPNYVATAMSTGRTLTLGMLVPDIANPYFGQLVAAVERASSKRGYTVLVSSTELDPGLEARHVRNLADRQVDALVYLGGTEERNDAVVQLAKDGRPPIVAVDEALSWLPDTVTTVTVNNHVGGVLAAQHLIGLGHERLAALAGPQGLPTAQERWAGFEQACLRGGREPVHAFADAYTIDAGRHAASRLLATHSEVTGVFCGNDLIALGLVQVAAALGRRVPDDLSVVGFDDMLVSRLATPPLTTIQQPVEQFGRQAAEVGLALAAEVQQAPESRVLPVELIVRGSTGPPATGANR